MGTRADFYVGRGEGAEWLGSIAWDGFPAGIPERIKHAKDERGYRDAVDEFLAETRDGTTPDMGWPWPWSTSSTTDYAYAFDADSVYACPFGHGWFEATGPEPDEDEFHDGKSAVFPDMSKEASVTLGKRSGLIVFG